MERDSRRILKLVAFVAGVAIAIVALSGWRVADTNGRFGADVSFKAAPVAQLSVSRGDPFMVVTGLKPRAPLGSAGLVVLTNVTRRPQSFRLRAVPSSPGLGDLLAVQVTVGERLVYNGTLGGLAEWTTASFALEQGQQGSLELQAWLPRTSRAGYEGQIVDVDLEFQRADPGSGG